MDIISFKFSFRLTKWPMYLNAVSYEFNEWRTGRKINNNKKLIQAELKSCSQKWTIFNSHVGSVNHILTLTASKFVNTLIRLCNILQFSRM